MGAEVKSQILASTMERTLKEVQYVQEVTRIWKEHAEEGDLYTGEDALRRAIPSWADDYKHHEGLQPTQTVHPIQKPCECQGPGI